MLRCLTVTCALALSGEVWAQETLAPAAVLDALPPDNRLARPTRAGFPEPSIVVGFPTPESASDISDSQPDAVLVEPDPEFDLFEQARQSGSLSVLADFIRRTPDSPYRADAETEIDVLISAAALEGSAADPVAEARRRLRSFEEIPVSLDLAERSEDALGVTPRQIRMIQNSLVRRGYDIGRPDGIAGPRTREAIVSFRRANGLALIPVVTPALWRSIGLGQMATDGQSSESGPETQDAASARNPDAEIRAMEDLISLLVMDGTEGDATAADIETELDLAVGAYLLRGVADDPAAEVVARRDARRGISAAPDDLADIEGRLNVGPETLGRVSDALASAGYLGNSGALTPTRLRGAISSYRRDTGLPIMPLITPALMRKLGLPSTLEPASSPAEAPAPLEDRIAAARETGSFRMWQAILSEGLDRDTLAAVGADIDTAIATRFIAASTPTSPYPQAKRMVREGRTFDPSADDLAQIEAVLGTDTSLIVATVQTSLNGRGYNAGPEDGIPGRQTRRAIRAFQADNGVPRTGAITPATLAALGMNIPFVAPPPVAPDWAGPALRMTPEQIALFESDPRLIKAAEAIPDPARWTWGVRDGQLYIAVTNMTFPRMADYQLIAERMGGTLVQFDSRAEERFLVDRIAGDGQFWDFLGNGPTIGLVQSPGSAEPAGGWVWPDGSRPSYTNWLGGQPDNRAPGGGPEDHAVLTISGGRAPGNARWADRQTISPSFIVEIR